MRFGNLDLRQDELRVLKVQFKATHLISTPARHKRHETNCDFYSISQRSDIAFIPQHWRSRIPSPKKGISWFGLTI